MNVKASLAGGNVSAKLKIVAPRWMEDAECQRANPELFQKPAYGRSKLTPTQIEITERRRVSEAKSFCHGCGVREQCLRYALEMNDTDSILGGFTPSERRRMVKQGAKSGAA